MREDKRVCVENRGRPTCESRSILTETGGGGGACAVPLDRSRSLQNKASSPGAGPPSIHCRGEPGAELLDRGRRAPWPNSYELDEAAESDVVA